MTVQRAVEVKASHVGLIIGQKGCTLKSIEAKTLCTIRVEPKNASVSIVVISGRSEHDVEVVVSTIENILKQRWHLTCLFHGEIVSKGTLLYLDVSNYLSAYFFDEDWSIQRMVERVKSLVYAVKQQECMLIAFADGARVSDEACDKFKERRLKEVSEEYRNIPQNASWMVVEALQLEGIESRYSLETDNDHTLAYYAFEDKACVISGDQDFFRYGVSLTIFNAFNVDEHGKLLVQRATQRERRERLHLPTHAPKFTKFDDDSQLFQSKVNIGGTPTSLTKSLGNPHTVVRELRRVVYAVYLGEGEVVKESFPEWKDGQQATFTETDVTAMLDSSLEGLLQGDPNKLFEHYFPLECSEVHKSPLADVPFDRWYKHCMGCFSVVLELCCMYRAKTTAFPKSFLEHILLWEKGRERA